MRHRLRSKLTLGKRCKRTKNQNGIPVSLILDSIQTVVVYSPRPPAIKSFKTNRVLTPFKLTSSPMKEIKSLKRIKYSPLTNAQAHSPNKPPSIKKMKRPSSKNLFHSEVNETSEHFSKDMFIATLIKQTDNEESVKVVNDTTPQIDDFVVIGDVQTPSKVSTLSTDEIYGISNFNSGTDNNTTPNATYTHEIREMIELLPSVIDNLAVEGLAKPLLQFFRLVDKQKYPLDNIALHLWMEVVKWFDVENASQMRYSDVTKKFWKLGYRQFGGRFINFMT